jgi:hypothetical protein
MTGGEIVALASVVVTGALSPFIAARMAQRALAHQTRVSREDELRSVLENAGVKLTEALFALDGVRSKMPALDRSELAPFSSDREQLWKNDDRLAVRLGSSAPEVDHYRRAIEELSKAATILEEVADGQGFDTEGFKQLKVARQAALEAQYAFYDASSRRIGPGDPPRRKFKVPRPHGG